MHKKVRWRTSIILVFLLLFSSSLVTASSTMALTPVDNEITVAEEASFRITITNNEDISQWYTVYGLEVVWSVTPEPRRFTLRPGQSKTIEVMVRPLGPFKPSAYSIKLYVDESRSSSSPPSSRYQQEMPVILYPDEPQEYLPALGLHIEVKDQVDPQQQVPLAVQLVNRNPLNLTDLTIRIQSDMPEFAQEMTLSLSPREEKTVEFMITPWKFQAPREYTLFFILERAGQVIKIVEKKISIIPLKIPFSVRRADSTLLLKTATELTITNPGNVPDTQNIKIPVSFWQALFTSGDARVVREQGQRSLVWEQTLDPAESGLVRYTTNYRIPAYLFIMVLIAGLFYFYARSPVELRKSAVTAKAGEDGTLSEVKITLEVKNLSGRSMKEVIITDLIPSIANLEKGLDLGTLKPAEVKHTQKGTKVIWSLAELDAHEHRLITYKIKAKLNILGTFSLPRGSMEYTTLSGRKRKAYSNIYRLG